MNDKIERIFANLIPFIILGIVIALVVGLFIMFSYVVMWGILIGAILWAVYSIKHWLFSSSNTIKKSIKTKGRIIQHDDND